MTIEPIGAFGEAVVTKSCAKCCQPVPVDELCWREVVWEDGGQAGEDVAEVCVPCANEIDREGARLDYYADPFNRDYERARANGWSD